MIYGRREEMGSYLCILLSLMQIRLLPLVSSSLTRDSQYSVCWLVENNHPPPPTHIIVCAALSLSKRMCGCDGFHWFHGHIALYPSVYFYVYVTHDSCPLTVAFGIQFEEEVAQFSRCRYDSMLTTVIETILIISNYT
jgi:hypothetical protein